MIVTSSEKNKPQNKLKIKNQVTWIRFSKFFPSPPMVASQWLKTMTQLDRENDSTIKWSDSVIKWLFICSNWTKDHCYITCKMVYMNDNSTLVFAFNYLDNPKWIMISVHDLIGGIYYFFIRMLSSCKYLYFAHLLYSLISCLDPLISCTPST